MMRKYGYFSILPGLLNVLFIAVLQLACVANCSEREIFEDGNSFDTKPFARKIHTNNFGGEVVGINLETVTDTEFDFIYQTLLQYKVVAIRNQSSLSVDGQRRFTKRFGELQVHIESASHYPGYEDVNVVSNIKSPETGAYTGLYGKHVENFHADLSWAVFPTKVTVVKAVIRPEGCGHTEFSDSSASFQSLSPDTKALVIGKKAKYCYLKTRDIKDDNSVEGLTVQQVQQAQQCAIHPVITTHPDTGGLGIYANPSHTTEIFRNDTRRIQSLVRCVIRCFGIARTSVSTLLSRWRFVDLG